MIEPFTHELGLVLDPAHCAEVLERSTRGWGDQLLGRRLFVPRAAHHLGMPVVSSAGAGADAEIAPE